MKKSIKISILFEDDQACDMLVQTIIKLLECFVKFKNIITFKLETKDEPGQKVPT